MSDTTEGWGFPLASRKAHYFRDARSLCGKWLFTGRLEPPENTWKTGPDDCVPCRRALDKERAPAAQ